jgi:hypothetical protein
MIPKKTYTLNLTNPNKFIGTAQQRNTPSHEGRWNISQHGFVRPISDKLSHGIQ